MLRSELDNLHTEGERAIEDLAHLARELGYKGFCDQLQLNNGRFVSDILAMFEDNPGMVEAIYNFVAEHEDSYEWEEEDEEEESDDHDEG